jgi:inosine/xanthosine triphosphate pyrophosphatase family protein
MKELVYATGNQIKFIHALAICDKTGLKLTQTKLDIEEIQAETGEPIARDKAEVLDTPLVVSDESFMIPGLKGFPGPYMKYLNDWFTTDDWLRLTSSLTDRRVIKRQVVVYQDVHMQKLFALDTPALLLTEPRGESPYTYSTIISYDGGKTSSAEHHEQGKSATEHIYGPWHEFAAWYIQENL